MTLTDISTHTVNPDASLDTEPDRWRPARAGLIALWRYWDEVFTFHHGRLLLRGANGSGKSMALELLLPFLFDADTSPHRLTSAAKSRGGLFDRMTAGSEDGSRTGFAWVEFTRGQQERFTIGVRLRTSTATRKVDSAYFTTTQRIGTELQLLDTDRTPLSRKALDAAIGDHGRVHPSAEEHRNAVRTTLFPGFSAERYGSVITALLALRKEKLSQNLDLAKLSEVLSEALTPIDDHELAAVAEGFERLDRRRAQLERLAKEVAEVRLLEQRQREYARAVLWQVAKEVRQTESIRDTVTRGEREAGDQLEETRSELDATTEQLAAARDRSEAIGTEREALRDSELFKEGAGLAELERQVRRLAEGERRARLAADRADAAAAEDAAAHTKAIELLALARDNHQHALIELRGAAGRANAESALSEDLGADIDPDQIDPGQIDTGQIDTGERLVAAWLRARETAIAEVRTALHGHERAVTGRDHAQEQADRDLARAEQRAQTESQARGALDHAVQTYQDQVRSWIEGCPTIGAARLRELLPGRPDGPEQIQAAVGGLRTELSGSHQVARAGLDGRREQVTEQRRLRAAERESYATGQLVTPDPPDWRDPRTDRAGAPLWRLVEVAEGASAEEIDAVETALDAAGLLDAWVRPDGHIEPSAHDLTLTVLPVTGRSLRTVLEPLPDAAVPTDQVSGVLASIAVADTIGEPIQTTQQVVIGIDGTFRIGSAHGRARPVPATLLGAAARERRRLARLAELDADLAELDAELAGLRRQTEDLDRAWAAARSELDLVPTGAEVLAARTALQTAADRLAEAEDSRAESADALTRAEEKVREALRTLNRAAAEHRLPSDPQALTELEEALAAVQRATHTWAARARDWLRAAADLADRRERHDRSLANQQAQAEEHREAERDHRAAEQHLATLEANVGASYRRILDQLGQLDREETDLRAATRQLEASSPALQRRIGQLEERLRQAVRDREQAEAARQASHDRFRAAFATGFGADAQVTVPASLEGVTAIRDTGRELAAELGFTTDPDLDQLNSRLAERRHQTSSQVGGRVDLDLVHDPARGWWVLTATSGGVRRRVSEFLGGLRRELAAGREELDAEEERLFEQVLAGDIRRSLAARIRSANGLVNTINKQLSRVSTAAGRVGVRLRWIVDEDQPEAVKAARELLLRDPHDLAESDTRALQEFVRARVDQARAELEANAPWEARLRETLDYRSWHRFGLQVSHRDWAGHRPATPSLLQKLSTGERSIVLHLPMIASIAAHYTDPSGAPSACPRLILLDELFAGVDPVNRAQLFGTFTDWDLDAVFTSDHEWCQYASLDGIAIHHLHPPTGGEPVTSTRFTWDGRERLIDQAGS